jgi:hypothetical protein
MISIIIIIIIIIITVIITIIFIIPCYRKRIQGPRGRYPDGSWQRRFGRSAEHKGHAVLGMADLIC